MACAFRGVLRFRDVKYCALILLVCILSLYLLTPSEHVCDFELASHSTRNVSDTPPAWEAVIPGKLYVYSAFYTLPSHCTSGTLFNTIKIIALLNRKATAIDAAVKCWCLYGNTTINAELQENWDHHYKVYAAGTITCTTPKVDYLSYVDLRCQMFSQIGTSRLSIMPPPFSPRPLSFAMCGPIIYGSDTMRTEYIVEFVEYYRMMGVSKFLFYLYDAGLTADLIKVLKHYSELGLVEILDWKLPSEIEDRLWYNGQLAALNDCMMRIASYGWDYAVLVDLDEFIISSGEAGLQNVVNNGSRDCVQIRHSAIRTNSSSSSLRMRLEPHLKRTRDACIFWRNWRSKYICRPKSVLSAGIHSYDAVRPGTRILTADVGETVLLHFGNVPEMQINGLIKESTRLVDVDMGQFFGLERLRQLTDKVNSVHRSIFGR